MAKKEEMYLARMEVSSLVRQRSALRCDFGHSAHKQPFLSETMSGSDDFGADFFFFEKKNIELKRHETCRLGLSRAPRLI